MKKYTGIFIGTKITIVKNGKVQSRGIVKTINRDWTGTYLVTQSKDQIRIVK